MEEDVVVQVQKEMFRGQQVIIYLWPGIWTRFDLVAPTHQNLNHSFYQVLVCRPGVIEEWEPKLGIGL
jgi:hypothetical protein